MLKRQAKSERENSKFSSLRPRIGYLVVDAILT